MKKRYWAGIAASVCIVAPQFASAQATVNECTFGHVQPNTAASDSLLWQLKSNENTLYYKNRVRCKNFASASAGDLQPFKVTFDTRTYVDSTDNRVQCPMKVARAGATTAMPNIPVSPNGAQKNLSPRQSTPLSANDLKDQERIMQYNIDVARQAMPCRNPFDSH